MTKDLQLPGSYPPAIDALVATARESFAGRFTPLGLAYETSSWNVKGLRHRKGVSSNTTLYFTRLDDLEAPLPAPYADVVKAWVVLDARSITAMNFRVATARVLWEVLLERRGARAWRAEDWSALGTGDLAAAETRMHERWSLTSVYRHAQQLAGLASFLSRRQVAPGLYYAASTPRPEDAERNTLAGAEEASDAKMPSPDALDAIADLYAELVVDGAGTESDQLCLAVISILSATGFRPTELLSLPADCEVREMRDGIERYSIRYWRAKGKSDRPVMTTKLLGRTQRALVDHAITVIRRITEAARRQADVLERAETDHGEPTVPLDLPDDRVLTAAEATTLCGFEGRTVIPTLVRTGELRAESLPGKPVRVRVGSLRAYLAKRRIADLWILDKRRGVGRDRYQWLSESLLVVHANFFHARRGMIPLLVEPFDAQTLRDVLAGRGEMRSIFERADKRDAAGQPHRMTPKQVRHWLTDLADKGGMPRAMLTRYMGRSFERDTEAYLHWSPRERIEWVREGIQDRSITGPIAEAYRQLAPEAREVFLIGQIQAVHVTQFGICVHDFSVSPCAYFLNCVAGSCPDYLRTKGSEREQEALVQIQRHARVGLEAAQRHLAAGTATAQAWVDVTTRTLAGVEAALSIEDGEEPHGTVLRPFAGGTRPAGAIGIPLTWTSPVGMPSE